jgi:hypothetical protein
MTFSTLTIAELRHRAAQLRLQAARIPDRCSAGQYQRRKNLSIQADDYENLLDMALRAKNGE